MSNPWNEWLWKAQVKELSKAPAPAPKSKAERALIPHRPITEDELLKLNALMGVRLGQNVLAARFLSQYQGATTETLITERQGWYIRVLWYRYRKQLGVSPVRPEGYL